MSANRENRLQGKIAKIPPAKLTLLKHQASVKPKEICRSENVLGHTQKGLSQNQRVM